MYENTIKVDLQSLNYAHFINLVILVYTDGFKKYSEYEKQGVILVEMKDSSLMRVKELQNRIKDLEQIVGQKQIKIDFLEKMIELSKSEFGIDVKKKSTMPHLSGLEISKNS